MPAKNQDAAVMAEPAVMPIVVSADDFRNQQIAAAKAEAAANPRDVTVPGGRYLVGGQWVDANGAPIPATRDEADEG